MTKAQKTDYGKALDEMLRVIPDQTPITGDLSKENAVVLATGSIFDDTPMGQWRRDMAKHTFKGKSNPFMFRLAQETLKAKTHEPVYVRTTYAKSLMPMETVECPTCGAKHGFFEPEEKERECGSSKCDGKVINPFSK